MEKMMKPSLYKHILYSFLIDPLIYVSSILTVTVTAFFFYFTNSFFIPGQGSSDLTLFFNSIAGISVLTVPLLVYRVRYFIKDDSLPVNAFIRFITVNLAVFTVSLIPLLFLSFIPVSVNFFGKTDAGQCAGGFAGIIFYLFAAISFTVFIFSVLKNSQSALSLLAALIILSTFNYIHILLPLINLSDFITELLKKVSFVWHFDSASKGLLDSRDFIFFIFSSVFFIFLSGLAEYRRTELKISGVNLILFLLTFIFLSVSFSRICFNLDLTEDRLYTVSPLTKKLTGGLENPLRITYFQSKELKKYYPQTRLISEYLNTFAKNSPYITYSKENADSERLKNYGISGRHLKTENSSKLEYTTVYSAVLLQYLDKSTVIPFVISTKTLEYDLAQRIQEIITKEERILYVISGNGFSVEEDYAYLLPWLNSRGFHAQSLNPYELEKTFQTFDYSKKQKPSILLLGTKKLTAEGSYLIKNAAEKGCPLLVMTSPYTADIKNDWNVTKNKNDSFIPVLNGWGFAFDYSLAQDLSNFPLTMTTGEGENISYQTVNYPLWINVIPQKEAFEGVTVCWASPVLCYGKVKPLLTSSSYGWTQSPSTKENEPFIVNPFLIPQTASQAGEKTQNLVLAAELFNKEKNISAALISDQFFNASLITGFTSTTEQGDFRNYDYTVSILLKLSGEEELASLMQKSQVSRSLYKIETQEYFIKTKNQILLTVFIIIPVLILASGAVFNLIRMLRMRKNNVKN